MENGGSGEEFPDDESDDGLDDDSSLSDWNLRKVSIMWSLLNWSLIEMCTDVHRNSEVVFQHKFQLFIYNEFSVLSCCVRCSCQCVPRWYVACHLANIKRNSLPPRMGN